MRWPAVLLGLFAACGGGDLDPQSSPDAAASVDAGLDCTGAPAAPSILSPASGVIDVTTESLVVRASPFSAPDGVLHSGTEVELWTVSGSGNLKTRVWTATMGDSREIAFAGGTGLGALEPWERYAAVVKDLGAREGCPARAATSLPAVFRADDGSTALFDPTQLRTFALELSPTTIQQLNNEAIPPDCLHPPKRTYRRGTVIIDGVRYENVGVKLKGGCGSARNMQGKAAFKIKLDWDDPDVPGCPAERRHGGQSTFTLNNMVQDPTLSHERLGYAFFEAMGVPAARAAPVMLSVNGTAWGVYLNLETASRRFLARHYPSNGGMLYEGEYTCDIVYRNMRDEGCFSLEFTPDACDEAPDEDDDPQDFTAGRELASALDEVTGTELYPALQRILDWDKFVSMWAADAVLNNWDGYGAGLNNYRLYHEPTTGLSSIIPSGLDQVLRLEPYRDDPFLYSSRITLACTSAKACRDAFAARLAEALDLYEAMDFEARRETIEAQLKRVVQDVTGRGPGISAFSLGHRELKRVLPQRLVKMRQALIDHGY